MPFLLYQRQHIYRMRQRDTRRSLIRVRVARLPITLFVFAYVLVCFCYFVLICFCCCCCCSPLFMLFSVSILFFYYNLCLWTVPSWYPIRLKTLYMDCFDIFMQTKTNKNRTGPGKYLTIFRIPKPRLDTILYIFK